MQLARQRDANYSVAHRFGQLFNARRNMPQRCEAVAVDGEGFVGLQRVRCNQVTKVAGHCRLAVAQQHQVGRVLDQLGHQWPLGIKMVGQQINHYRAFDAGQHLKKQVNLLLVNLPVGACTLVKRQQLQGGEVTDLHLALRATWLEFIEQPRDAGGAIQHPFGAEGVDLVNAQKRRIGQTFITAINAFYSGRQVKRAALGQAGWCLCLGYRYRCQQRCGQNRRQQRARVRHAGCARCAHLISMCNRHRVSKCQSAGTAPSLKSREFLMKPRQQGRTMIPELPAKAPNIPKLGLLNAKNQRFGRKVSHIGR